MSELLPPPIKRHLEGVVAGNPKKVVGPLWKELVVATEVDGKVVELHGRDAVKDVVQGVESLHLMLEDVMLTVREIALRPHGWVKVISGRVRSKKDRKFVELRNELGWEAREYQTVNRSIGFQVAGEWIAKLGDSGVIERGLKSGSL